MSSIPAYQASGLASNMDTQGIIDKLVTIEGMPLTTIATKQSAISVKISSIGTLMSNLEALGTQAKFLSTNGLSAVSVGGTYSDFNISGAPANPGRYSVKVQDLARAAKARSTTVYGTADAVVTATDKTLSLKVDGTQHDLAVTAGTTLSQLVTQINGANKPFTASLVSDGTQYYVTLTRKDTGFVVGQPAGSALEVVSTLGVNQDLGLGLASPAELLAKNSVTYVDGLRIERRNNELTDVVPGATLSLKAASNANLDVVFNADSGSSASMLGNFVDKYNKVAAFLRTQMDSDPSSKQAGDKLGSSIAFSLQRGMERLVGSEVNSTGAIRTLRNLGVTLQKDGTLKLDATVLTAALVKDPSAVNSVFSKANTGLGTTFTSFVSSQNSTSTSSNLTGFLVSRRDSLDKATKALSAQSTALTTHLDAYRRQLNIQFTSLESVMAGVNNTARFLDSQDAQLHKK